MFFYRDEANAFVAVKTGRPGSGSLEVGYGRTPGDAVAHLQGTPFEAHTDPEEGLGYLSQQSGIQYNPDDYTDVTDDVEGGLRNALETAVESAQESWTGWDWPHDPGGIVVAGPGPQSDWDAWETERRAELTIADLVDLGLDTEYMDPEEVDSTLAGIATAERDYGEKAQHDAEAAADAAVSCLEAAALGANWQRALQYAKEAVSLENDYGDAPAYTPVRDVCARADAWGF